ncbi:MAG: isoamylase [Chlamydiales bacterium]
MKTAPGNPDPLGFSLQGGSANFSLYSSHATAVFLGLFDLKNTLVAEFLLCRTGDVWHIGIPDFPHGLTYAYRCEGAKELLYDPEKWLVDPYAKQMSGGRAEAALPIPFDWQGDRSPNIPSSDLILYEMHVRGFTKDPSSGVKAPGTYLGMIEKIPYLKKLGVNGVELMPIFGFDQKNSKNGVNYWGYNSLHFFIPMSWYALKDPVLEFKTLVRELHKEEIKVILDVVYNHTGEGSDPSHVVNFRGIDNAVYYLLKEDGSYLDFTGCGNTFNTNHPAVQRLILDSLRYWIQEMHVDGFRFDLASIFTRDVAGRPMEEISPILKAIRMDPVISQVKLISEAWDASGLYQLGLFPTWGPWSEWNGRYRDIVRRFMRGIDGKAGLFASALCGSEMIYHASETPLSSINFITAHDGFTLRDLVTYQHRYNYANGEDNRDGNHHNDSWNCGSEGPTDDVEILALRERQMRNFLLALFLSQGIPMLLMGDEYGHTRLGNNNPYTQDNELNWFLWDKQNPKIVHFVSSLIAFRLKHKNLRHTRFLRDEEVEWDTNWDASSRFVAFRLNGPTPLYIAFNANHEKTEFALPQGKWRTVVNTAEDWIFHEDGAPIESIELLPHSALLAFQIPPSPV